MSNASQLPFKDRYLTVWILLAMAFGVGLGTLVPESAEWLSQWQSGSTSWALAFGLILMMYPPLAKVRYEELPGLFRNPRMLALSLFQNWIVGPGLMFMLAILFLKPYPELMTGVILIGLARCIAMVIVWNEMACGNRETCAGLVAINSIFQILTFPFFATFFINLLPRSFGLEGVDIHLKFSDVAGAVSLYLGIPLVAGFLSRMLFRRLKGDAWYEAKFLRRVGPMTFWALIFTIVLLFALQGNVMLAQPERVLLVAVPLTIYFVLMFFVSYWMSWRMGISAENTTALSLTAASNNFELAIAVAIGSFGLQHGAAFAAVIGPLIEVPVLLLLVKVAGILENRFYETRKVFG